MTDRELLEMAAKAAGVAGPRGEPLEFSEYGSCTIQHAITGERYAYKFNPLVDDGDALRLAAKLKIDIEWQATNPFPEPRVEAYQRNDEGSYFCSDEHEDNYRRAIVRAAAEIGKEMP